MVVLGTTRLSEYLLEVVSAGSTSLISSGCLSLSGTSSLFAALLKAGVGSLVIRYGIRVRVRVRVSVRFLGYGEILSRVKPTVRTSQALAQLPSRHLPTSSVFTPHELGIKE